MNTKSFAFKGLTLAGILMASASSAMAALPTSGKCGFILTVPHPTLAWSVGTKNAVRISDILGTIDFSSNTVSYNATTLTYDGSAWQYGSTNGSVIYAIGNALANPAGAYPITFSVSGTDNVSAGNVTVGLSVSVSTTLNLLPTNSSNTVLVQGADEKMTGVCQMI